MTQSSKHTEWYTLDACISLYLNFISNEKLSKYQTLINGMHPKDLGEIL